MNLERIMQLWRMLFPKDILLDPPLVRVGQNMTTNEVDRPPDYYVTLEQHSLTRPFGPGPEPADSNMRVPVWEGDFDDVNAGRAKGWWSGDTCRWQIFINTPRLRRMGAGPNDIARVLGHEKDHCRRWDHYEGTSATNRAYHPSVRLTGR